MMYNKLMDKFVFQLFKNRKLNDEKLLNYGFKKENNYYLFQTLIIDKQMRLTIKVEENDIESEIFDIENKEPYALHLIENAVGSFVGRVRDEYTNVLQNICERCFDKEIFHFEQTKKLIKFIKEKYNDELEFLWEKFSDTGVWRRNDNRKWYGILLKISKRKLGINSDEMIEVIDIRINSDELDKIVDNKKYFRGYHMNKKHWMTIILDNTVSDEELFERVNNSYKLAK